MNFPEIPGCCLTWAVDDPLDDLFRVWFGAYGTSAQGVSLEKQFAARATQARIDDGAEVPADPASWITPITATHGNPLALLELVRGLTPDQLAGGFGLPGAARRASENHAELGHTNWAVAELVEAAARSGMTETAAGAYRRLAEMTGASGTDWGLGVQAVTRAAQRRRGCRAPVPRGDRPPWPDPHPRGACPRPSAVRRVAAPGAPPR